MGTRSCPCLGLQASGSQSNSFCWNIPGICALDTYVRWTNLVAGRICALDASVRWTHLRHLCFGLICALDTYQASVRFQDDKHRDKFHGLMSQFHNVLMAKQGTGAEQKPGRLTLSV